MGFVRRPLVDVCENLRLVWDHVGVILLLVWLVVVELLDLYWVDG